MAAGPSPGGMPPGGVPCAIAGKVESTSAPLVAIAQHPRRTLLKFIITNSPHPTARAETRPLNCGRNCPSVTAIL
jgi:hypothetical protein